MNHISMVSKALEIVVNTINIGKAIAAIAKQFPKGKHRKNVFIKEYNRRPRNKAKRASLIRQAAITAAICSIQNRVILSQPIPSYIKGSNCGPDGMYEVTRKEQFDGLSNLPSFKFEHRMTPEKLAALLVKDPMTDNSPFIFNSDKSETCSENFKKDEQ